MNTIIRKSVGKGYQKLAAFKKDKSQLNELIFTGGNILCCKALS